MTGQLIATPSFQISSVQLPSGTAKNSGSIKSLVISVAFMQLSQLHPRLTVLFTGKATT